tara:strand:+ start:131 stop:1150 length:1020 start_codon:yes stop_codon:yes gene_type:complete
MLTESQVVNIENLLHEAIDALMESGVDEPSPTYEWNVTKDKVKESIKDIKTLEQAKKYLDILLVKIKKLPKKVKIKILKYAFAFLVGIMGYAELHDYASENANEINDEVSVIDLSVDLTAEKEAESDNVKSNDDTEVSNVKEIIYNQIPHKISDSFIDFVKKEEGSIRKKGEPVLTAYDLGDGMITVGWGHAEKKNISKFKVGEKITRAKAEELLSDDLKSAKDAVNSVFEDWSNDGVSFYVDQDMYDAMVSMAFNMGRGGFRSTEFIQLVKKGQYEEAGDKILSTRITYPGHIHRRKKESDMFGKSLGINPLNIKLKNSKNIISENHKKRLKELAGLL